MSKFNANQFKKGEWKKAEDIIMYDLECLSPKMKTKEFNYHYYLLKGNLEDLFGITKREEIKEKVREKLNSVDYADWDVDAFMDEHFCNEKSVAWNVREFKKWIRE